MGLVAATGVLLALIYALHPRTPPQTQALPAVQARAPATHLRPVSDFAAIADPQTRSIALFVEAGRVIQSPRCMNCHPRTDRPTQTDAMRPHTPWVSRGVDGRGATTMRCSTCHHETNFELSGVPGNPRWRLAPANMAWQGKSLGDICRQIQDPARGGMSRAELLHHMSQDVLVGWAWRPGGNRTPAPGTQAEFGAIIKAWLDTGAKCPQ
ncbi:Isoquinoline 1-oxidoreductase subunit [Phenylobacterium sp. LjRoot219]|uniref:Isoquinoline 1-oxidoreductase subunit n=1 Tax=Phenylobacterium sp. LjRoot219 TaxID=3342283 RepID=UPI003ECF7FAB